MPLKRNKALLCVSFVSSVAFLPRKKNKNKQTSCVGQFSVVYQKEKEKRVKSILTSNLFRIII